MDMFNMPEKRVMVVKTYTNEEMEAEIERFIEATRIAIEEQIVRPKKERLVVMVCQDMSRHGAIIQVHDSARGLMDIWWRTGIIVSMCPSISGEFEVGDTVVFNDRFGVRYGGDFNPIARRMSDGSGTLPMTDEIRFISPKELWAKMEYTMLGERVQFDDGTGELQEATVIQEHAALAGNVRLRLDDGTERLVRYGRIVGAEVV